MNKVWKIAVITAIINFVLLTSGILTGGFIFIILVLIIELIASIILCFIKENRIFGQGILLGLGLFLLIGGVVCSIILTNTNFH